MSLESNVSKIAGTPHDAVQAMRDSQIYSLESLDFTSHRLGTGGVWGVGRAANTPNIISGGGGGRHGSAAPVTLKKCCDAEQVSKYVKSREQLDKDTFDLLGV